MIRFASVYGTFLRLKRVVPFLDKMVFCWVCRRTLSILSWFLDLSTMSNNPPYDDSVDDSCDTTPTTSIPSSTITSYNFRERKSVNYNEQSESD